MPEAPSARACNQPGPPFLEGAGNFRHGLSLQGALLNNLMLPYLSPSLFSKQCHTVFLGCKGSSLKTRKAAASRHANTCLPVRVTVLQINLHFRLLIATLGTVVPAKQAAQRKHLTQWTLLRSLGTGGHLGRPGNCRAAKIASASVALDSSTCRCMFMSVFCVCQVCVYKYWTQFRERLSQQSRLHKETT